MTIRAGLARRLTIILFAFGAMLSAAIGGIGYGTYMDMTFAQMSCRNRNKFSALLHTSIARSSTMMPLASEIASYI